MAIDDLVKNEVVSKATSGKYHLFEIIDELDISKYQIKKILKKKSIKANYITNSKKRKYVNENFFNNQSMENSYILGLFYASLNPHYKYEDVFVFSSKYKKLTETVKEKLESKSKIINPRGRNSYIIEINNKNIHEKLDEFGLWKNKNYREFLNINEDCLSDFIRGFFDSQGYIKRNNNGNNYIIFDFNKKFLGKLNKILSERAGAKLRNIRKSKSNSLHGTITYKHEDCMKIYNYIYKDFDYIKKNNLYLKEKRDLFNLNYDPNKYFDLIREKTGKRINKAKELLSKGYNGVEVSEKLKYCHVFQFYSMFKKHTGFTVKQFINQLK